MHLTPRPLRRHDNIHVLPVNIEQSPCARACMDAIVRRDYFTRQKRCLMLETLRCLDERAHMTAPLRTSRWKAKVCMSSCGMKGGCVFTCACACKQVRWCVRARVLRVEERGRRQGRSCQHTSQDHTHTHTHTHTHIHTYTTTHRHQDWTVLSVMEGDACGKHMNRHAPTRSQGLMQRYRV